LSWSWEDILECLLEAADGVVEVDADGAFGGLEGEGDVSVGEVVVEAHGEDLTLGGAEGVEGGGGALKLCAGGQDVVLGGLRIGRRGVSGGVRGEQGGAGVVAVELVQLVEGDAQEPATEGGGFAEVLEALNHLDEGLLEEVSAVGVVGVLAHEGAVDEALVGGDQGEEGGLVVALRAADEVSEGGGRVFGGVGHGARGGRGGEGGEGGAA
jgi:hypothetical protein